MASICDDVRFVKDGSKLSREKSELLMVKSSGMVVGVVSEWCKRLL